MPIAAREAIERLLAPLRGRHEAVRWLDPISFHVTLVFLGSLPAERVARVVHAAAAVAEATATIGITTGRGGGNAGGRRPGVAWLDLAGGRREVADLAGALDVALLDAGVISEPTLPASGSRPHITIARRATPELVAELRREPPRSVPAAWAADRAVLYRSHLGRAGSVYEEVASLPLAGQTPAGADAVDRGRG